MSVEEHEEHVITIVASLMKNSRGRNRPDFSKFSEADHEKVERLMELHLSTDRVAATESKLRKRNRFMAKKMRISFDEEECT